MSTSATPSSPIPPDRSALGPLISQVSRLWRRTVDHRLLPFGLSQASWRPLLYLARTARPMHQKDLAQALLVDSSSVVRILDALQESGYIERQEGQPDRRAKRIVLTRQGGDIVTQLEQVSTQVRDEALARVTRRELAITLRVMEKIRVALERADHHEPPR